MPLAGAATTCSIFIASMTSSCWPAWTSVALGDVDADDRALQRRGTATVPSGPVTSHGAAGRDRRCGGRRRRGDRAPFAVGQHGQGVARRRRALTPAGWARLHRRRRRRGRCASSVAAAARSSARWVVDEAWCRRAGDDVGVGAGGAEEARRWSPRPRRRLGQRPAGAGRAAAAKSGRRRGRSPWRAASRSGGWSCSRRSRRCRRARRDRAGSSNAVSVAAGRPGRAVGVHRLGVDPRLDGATRGGRHLGLGQAELGRAWRRRPARAARATRSTPVTSSVTVCSTWRRGLASMNAQSSGRRASTRNSNVPRLCVVDLAGEAHARRRAAGPAAPAVERRARRHLDQLLVAALDRALALAEVGHGAAAVADDLHLDVAGARRAAARRRRRRCRTRPAPRSGSARTPPRGPRRRSPPACRARRRRPPP